MSGLSSDAFVRLALAAAAPPERVSEVVARLAGDKITIGPMAAGPCEAALATAIGMVGAVASQPSDDTGWDQLVTIPIELSVFVEVAGGLARFRGPVQVQTRIRLEIAEPCDVVVHVEEVTAADVTTAVEAIGLPARIVGRVGRVDEIVVDQVVTYVNGLISSPETVAALRIDVTGLLGRAWEADLVIEFPATDGQQPLDVVADPGSVGAGSGIISHV